MLMAVEPKAVEQLSIQARCVARKEGGINNKGVSTGKSVVNYEATATASATTQPRY